ncbi:MAG: RuBisCO large subunit C-terminal-like domain-containing protein [Myxococcota bacterium]
MESVRVSYRARVEAGDVEARAEALLLEQTVELPRSAVRDAFVLREILGSVEEIAPDPDGGFRVAIAFPIATTGLEPAQLLNVLFGNSSLLPDIELVDMELPDSALESFGGPRFGIAGFRAAAEVPTGPLTCTALKPMGLSPEALGDLCETFARAGIDVIKDDHGLADQAFCRFEDRVRACQVAVEKAADATGRRSLYVPNLSGSPAALERQLRLARGFGVGAIMLSPMLIGLPVLCELATRAGLPILAHPAFGGAQRIAPELLLGKIFRLFGADAVIYPNQGGRFSYGAEVCRGLADALRQPWQPLAPALPVPAGGMALERVPELVDFYGPDAMLLIGGSLYEAGDALLERSRSFVASVRRAFAAGAGEERG